MGILEKASTLLSSLNQNVMAIKRVQKQIDEAAKNDPTKLEDLFALEFKFAMEISSTFESLCLLLDKDPESFTLRRIKKQADRLMGDYYEIA